MISYLRARACTHTHTPLPIQIPHILMNEINIWTTIKASIGIKTALDQESEEEL